ncbi:MAG: hypothetical protein WCP20_10865 [Desulfuromonadales bacterium]
MTTDGLTTICGVILAVTTAAQTSFATGVPATTADWLKLAMAAAFAAIGYFTNKQGSIQVTTGPKPTGGTTP